MIIRPIAHNDVDALLGLARHALSFASTDTRFWDDAPEDQVRRRLEYYLSGDTYSALVAEAEQEIVGFIAGSLLTDVERTDRAARIDLLAVEQRHRGHGIGTQLVREMTAVYRQRGVQEVQVGVVCANEPALRFWRRAGFRELYITMSAPLAEKE